MTRLALFGRREELRRRTVAGLGLAPGDRVLDLACGAGADLGALSDAVGARGEIVAIDASAEMVERARRRADQLAARVELRVADLATAELEPSAYGGALIALALSALPDRLAALERVRAALRPGARLGVLDTLPFEGSARVLNAPIGALFGALTNWDAEADLIGELEAGFDGVEVERFNAGSTLVAVAGAPAEADR